MSNDGANVLKLVKQVRQLCEQISLLLLTADKQMTKTGWNTTSNYALADFSYSIHYPSWWIPIFAFRYYKHRDYSNRLAYVSVLLDDHPDGEYTIKEPLVAAGFFDYGKTEADSWENWYARYYGHLSRKYNLQSDGQPFHFDAKMVPPNVLGKFQNGQVFAVPLVSITDEKDVKLQITDKLLKILEDDR